MKIPILLPLAMMFASLPLCHAIDYKLTLWNQHNSDHNDRGTRTCRIEAFKDDKSVFVKDNFKLIWRPSQDKRASVTIPLLADGADTIRITITEWIRLGGGLAEVEVFRGSDNITKDCKFSTSADFDERFTVDRLTDGITTSEKAYEGYWLLPNDEEGYVEIKLP